MVERAEPGKISIDHATRRGVLHVDAAEAKEDSSAPSGRKDITRPGDGVAETVELQHSRFIAGLVRGGLDNFRGLPPTSEEMSSLRDGDDNYRGDSSAPEAESSK